jgi:exopolysaccharide production protein ExoY
MHTAETSSEESTVNLSGRNMRVSRDSARSSNANNVQSDLHGDRIQGQDGFSSASSQKNSPPSLEPGVCVGRSDLPLWKRVLDVSCILLALPFWLPVFFLIGLWVKMVSSGPIFFRQERIGHLGRRFMILKFRTMKVNVETGVHERHLEQLIRSNVPMTKLDITGDPRIIPGGRILRAIGLDELPQLINVLRGEMSLVGPRPCTPNEFKSYKVSQLERLNALPGLTGYWQVNGKNKTTFSQMIEMDIFYTKNLTLWLDLQIIIRTFPAIIAQVIESRIAARRRPQSAAAGMTGNASALSPK